MSNEPLTRPDSAQEFPREIESYSRVRPGHFCVQSLISETREPAQEIESGLNAEARLRTAGETFEIDPNFVDGAGRVVQTPSTPMTYQPRFTEPTS